MKLLKILRMRIGNFLYSYLLIILFSLLWQVLPEIGVLQKNYTSTPLEIMLSILELARTGKLGLHLVISLQRILGGLSLSIVVGIPLGLCIGRLPRLEAFLDSTLQFCRQISSLALFPVFILFLGIGETSKVVIIFWASLWPVLLNTINGVKSVDSLYIKSVLTMGATKGMIFTKVILPASVPSILTGIRLASAYSVMVLVAAEMIGASSGLGFLVTNSQETFNIPQMYGAIVLLSILGILLNLLLSGIENRLIHWREYT